MFSIEVSGENDIVIIIPIGNNINIIILLSGGRWSLQSHSYGIKEGQFGLISGHGGISALVVIICDVELGNPPQFEEAICGYLKNVVVMAKPRRRR